MNFYDMIVGIPYIVTKDSDDDGGFYIDDKIILQHDGCIFYDQTGDWVNPPYFSESIIGMECKVDVNRLQEMIKTKEAILNQTKNNIKEQENFLNKLKEVLYTETENE